MADRPSGTKPLKLCVRAVILVVILSVLVLIWRPQIFLNKDGVNMLQHTDLQNEINDKISECLQKAETKTYEDFMLDFNTPNHPCSLISLEPLVGTLRKMLQKNNYFQSSMDSPVTSNQERNCDPCHRYKLLWVGREDNKLKNGQTVHEFMMRCSAQAPKLVSVPGRARIQNKVTTDEALPVPNIVHYVWYGKNAKFTFLNYLSFLGVHKYIKPDAIYLHGDTEPKGEWWTQTLKDVHNVYFVYKRRPTYIFGKKIIKVEHSADIARYEIIYEYGGIYLDTDVLVVKSFDPLRKFNFTLARADVNVLSNGIIIGHRGAPFFRMWIEAYRTFDPDEWGQHSVIMAGTLQKIYPTLVHVEEGTLVSPNYNDREKLFQKGYDWSKNYAVHIYKRNRKVPTDPEGIKKLDTLLGELMRYIYFGSKDLVTK